MAKKPLLKKSENIAVGNESTKTNGHVVGNDSKPRNKISNESTEDGADSDYNSDAESSVYSGLGESEDELSSSGSNSEDDVDDDDDDEEDDRSNVSKDELLNTNKVAEKSSVLGKQQMGELNPKFEEYEYDSSDEEDIRNTVGNIPMKWYDEYKHLGYDWDGKRIMKPKSSDELDKFLTKMEDPNYWKTVHDPSTGRDVILSNKDVDLIKNIQKGKFPDKNYDPYAPWIDFFTYDTMIHPVTNQPEHKRSFVPSYIEKRKVSKLVHAIKMGYYKPKPEKKEDEQPEYYLIWDKQDSITKRLHNNIPAPKLKLPGHEESYNPPPEYVLTADEEEKWKSKDPEDRQPKFLPQKYDSLREVPAYKNFIKERFERCLDLYLCPRKQKMRMNIDPEDLIPKLPNPKDLQPFPSALTLIYKGHGKMVRCLTVEPYGQFIASGCDDCTVKIWEILTGRCFSTIEMDGPVRSIAWCPNATICVLAVAVENKVVILNPKVGDKLISSNTDLLLTTLGDNIAGTSSPVEWRMAAEDEQEKGYRIVIEHQKEIRQITWHCKGDYFATVMDDVGNKSVMIHQLTKRNSQQPFSRPKGLVQCVLFHPTRPYFFVATQRYVRIYNLLKQELSKKLLTNSKWVSSIAVHPGGDNLIIGTYDCRLSWFDLDLSTKPYQTLRHHTKALRQVAYHRRYPLFASASDDGSVIVCHGMVYSDLLKNALIVPVKVLKGHERRGDFSVLDCQFHPTQPWIFTAGADGNIFLYT